jgi:hypothetical protein
VAKLMESAVVLDPLDGRHEDWDVGDKKTRN